MPSYSIVRADPPPYRLLILGDSLTAGFGVAEDQAWPARLKAIARENGVLLEVVNAGMSGDTSAGGKRRIAWLLRQPFDGFMLALGGNDALRGLDLKLTEQNLLEIVDEVKAKEPYAQLFLAGMKIPPNFGGQYARDFEDIFPRVAKARSMILIPFLLEGVAAEPSLNQPDRIHPNEEGHAIIAKNVWNALKDKLQRSNRGA